jgi:hypothetical protein
MRKEVGTLLTVRKVAATLGAMAIASGAAVVVFSSGPQAAQASPLTDPSCTKVKGTITCTTTVAGTPHRNWTQTVETTQKGNFDAQGGHPSQTKDANGNPAGKLPPGQQP